MSAITDPASPPQKDVRTRPRSTSEVQAVAIPLAISAIITGSWLELAFLRRGGSGTTILVTVLLCMLAMIFLTGVTLAAHRFARKGATASVPMQMLARCSFASCVLFLFMPEYVARVQPLVLRSMLLLTITTMLWLCLLTLCVVGDTLRNTTKILARVMAPLSVWMLFGIVTAIAIRKFQVFGYVGQDLAYFGQLMHTTLEGHIFWGNLLQDLLYSRPVTTDFAGHNSPIMFMFVPFYALYKNPLTLLLLRNLVIVCCAFPVYGIARRGASPVVSWLWATAFLLTPAILYQTTFDFYPLSVAALPILLSIYYYLEKRYAFFCLTLVLTLLVREDLAFYAIGLGIIARFAHRSVRWYLTPFAAGFAWAALSFLVVLPGALHGATFVTDACFSHLGHSRPEIVHTLLHHPQVLLSRGNLVYLKILLTPTAMLASLSSPFALLTLPYIGINLLAGDGRCITTVIFAQYSLVPATLLSVATIVVAIRPSPGLLARLLQLGLPNPAVAPLFLIAICFANLVFVTGEQQFKELTENTWNAEARTTLNLIPAGASVAAPRYLLPHLANRDCLYQTHRLKEYHTPVYEYLIVDKDWGHINAAQQYEAEYGAVVQDAESDPNLQTLYRTKQFEVLRNPSVHGQGCTPDYSSTGMNSK